MKRILTLLIAAICTVGLWAEEFTIDGMTFETLSNYEVALTGVDRSIYDVNIPSTVTYEGVTYHVTEIGGGAFYGNPYLFSITIPHGVRIIREWAFAKCCNLVSVTLPETLTSIEGEAFVWCYNLTSINIPKSMTNISWGVFNGCTNLMSITIPHSYISIGMYAFYDSGIYNNPSNWIDGVLYVNDCLLKADTCITGHYNIRENTKVISSEAFKACSNLSSVTIPESVTAIGNGAFEGTKMYTDTSNWENGGLYLGHWLIDVEDNLVGDYKIKDGTRMIANWAFKDCDSLTALTIPKSVTNIGRGVVSNCPNLSSIQVEKGNPRYDSRNNCNAIIETESNTLLYGCQNTIIPNGVTSIAHEAFEACPFTSITIPKSVVSIEDYAFGFCKELTEICYLGTEQEWDNISKHQEWNFDCDATIAYLAEEIQQAEKGDKNVQYKLGHRYYYGEGMTQDYTQAVYWLKKAGEQGHLEAQLCLGKHFSSGPKAQQDPTQAVYWWKKAAEQGHAVAQHELGECYYWGEGVAKDYAQVAHWCRKAANQGYAPAQNRLGYCYNDGKGLSQDIKQAVYWWCKAAYNGYAAAQWILGICYAEGHGTTQNYEQAVYWWKKAAEQGDAISQYYLGESYRKGQGIAKDDTQAQYWYRQAAEQGQTDAQKALKTYYGNNTSQIATNGDGNADIRKLREKAEQGNAAAQYQLGNRYKEGNGVKQDLTQAVYWWKKAAEQGIAWAQLELGFSYHFGNGITQDYTQAAYWWKKAAEQGEPTGQILIGQCYEFGDGVEQDYTQAVYWYQQVIDNEYFEFLVFDTSLYEAQYRLGLCYEEGNGVEQDYTKAVRLYEIAARNGHPDAQFRLGGCYWFGKGVTQDLTQAAYWWKKAAEQGHKGAKFLGF